MAELGLGHGLRSPSSHSRPCLLVADAALLSWTEQGLNATNVQKAEAGIIPQSETKRSTNRIMQIHGIINIYKKTKTTQKPEHTQSQLPLERAAVCSPLPAGKGWENKYQMPDVLLHNVLLENGIRMIIYISGE